MEKKKWVADNHHSEIQFKVKHLMISTVTGQFKVFSLELLADDDLANITGIFFTAETNSVNTNNEKRDDHLKSTDFFYSGQYKQIIFKSEGYNRALSNGVLIGKLTIRDITKSVEVTVEFGGLVVDPYGNTKAGFTISGKLSRKDFGLTWNAVTEAGNVVVADEIKFLGEIQMAKKV